MNLNLTLLSSEEMRAASAFIVLLADIREGSTRDGELLTAIMQKGLRNAGADLEAQVEDAIKFGTGATLVKSTPEGDLQTLRVAPAELLVEPPVKEAIRRTRKAKDVVALTGAQLAEQGNAAAHEAPEAKKPAENTGEEAKPSSTESTAPAASRTIDDVRAALQRYTASHSMTEGIALLKGYGAGRISELSEEQYPLFVAECDAPKEAA